MPWCHWGSTGYCNCRIQDKIGRFRPVRALIDAGSQSSFITEACAQRLCLPRQKRFQPILGLSETSVASNRGSVCCLKKPSHQENPILQTNAIVLNRITSFLPSALLNDDVKSYFQGLSFADRQFYLPGKIDFLIGADFFSQLFDGGLQSTPPHRFPYHFWLATFRGN